MKPTQAPWGYDSYTHTEVIPKPPPITWHWRLGPVRAKTSTPFPTKTTHQFIPSEVTMQLTADQQVELFINGEDNYGNKVDLSGDVVWLSSDESIIQVTNKSTDTATAVAVGPTGTASVTVTNDVDQDGTGDFQGSIAIDVVAGDIAEITIAAGEPANKPE